MPTGEYAKCGQSERYGVIMLMLRTIQRATMRDHCEWQLGCSLGTISNDLKNRLEMAAVHEFEYAMSIAKCSQSA